MRKFLLIALVALLAPVLSTAQTNKAISKNHMGGDNAYYSSKSESRVLIPFDAVGLPQGTADNTPGHDFSIGMWVKTTAIHTGNGPQKGLLFRAGPHKHMNINGAFLLYTESNGNLTLKFGGDNIATNNPSLSAGNASFNEWHHILMVFDSSSDMSNPDGGVRVYIDGVETLNNTEVNNFGYNWDDGVFQFICQSYSGDLDELQFFNSALTEAEAATAQINARYVSSLTSLYTFDEIAAGTTGQFASQAGSISGQVATYEVCTFTAYWTDGLVSANEGDTETRVETAPTLVESDRVTAPQSCSITIETPVNGTLSVTNADGTPVDDPENVLSGTELKVVATAATGYVLSNIAITANGVTSHIGSGDTFIVLGNTTVSATFVDKNDLVRVMINPPTNAGTSAFEVYNGDVKLNSGDRVPRGTVLTFVVHPTTELELDCYTINGATYKVDTYTINYDSQITAAFKELTPEQQVANATCTNPTTSTISATGRGLNSFIFKEKDGDNSIQVSVGQGSTSNGRAVYYDKTTSILTTKAGTTLNFGGIDWAGDWMHGYMYIDYNNDGSFNENLNTGGHNATEDVAGGEVVSYSFSGNDSSGKNSHGTVFNSETKDWNNKKPTADNMPEFTLPIDLTPGDYRARFKVDWNSLNACGDASIATNQGAIVDFIIHVEKTDPLPYGNTFSVTVSQGSGSWFACSELDGSLPAGECFTQESGIPETGKFYILTNSLQQLQSITIDNGGNSETITIDRSKKEYWNDYNTGEAGAITSIYRDGKYYYFDNIEGDVNVELVFDPNSSAIDGIATEKEADANAPVEYFNIHGVRVSSENLAPGFYIVRQGTKASKVYINK